MLPSPDQMLQCAPNVAPPTIAAIIQVESGGNAFALGVNGWHGPRPHPRTSKEAARLARTFIARGYSVDLGLMQINSRNLPGLGETVESIFEPCHNIHAGSRILSRGYAGAAKHFGPGQNALKAALSAYNTGNYEMGFKNGYVAKYYPGNSIKVTVRASSPKLLASVSKAGMPSNPSKEVEFADTTVYKRPVQEAANQSVQEALASQ